MSYENLRPLQRRFLRCFEACASVTQSARWAKCSRQMHYDWLEADEAYRRAFTEAEPRAHRALEDEAVRRAHQGVRKAIRYKGKIVGYETEFSDQLLITLLKTSPKFRDRSEVKHSGEITKRIIGVPDDEL